MALCADEGGKLISPEDAQLIDSDEELSHLAGGLYRTSGYWSVNGKFWFDAAEDGSTKARGPVTEWGDHIEPRLCSASGQLTRR